MGINAGVLQDVVPLTSSQIIQLENEVLAKKKIALYLEPDGSIRLISSWPIEPEVKDLAWHKLDLLVSQEDKEFKYEYFRTAKDCINFNLGYERTIGFTPWLPIISEKTALLNKALLGKMILGRRY